MSIITDIPGEDAADSTIEDSATIDATLTEYVDAVLSGEKFCIISLDHDDPDTVPSDALLQTLTRIEVVAVVDALVSDETTLATFQAVFADDNRRLRRDKITYVEARLLRLVIRYLAVKKYLQEEHGIAVPSDDYSNWKNRFGEQADKYMRVPVQEFSATAPYSEIELPNDVSETPPSSDTSIFAAIAVLQTIKHIAHIINLSVREMVAPLTLDSALQLSDLFAFCETSYALLNIEDIKERGWREIQAKNRRDAAASVRSAIRNRLIALLDAPDNERFRYKEGKRRGRLKIDYIVGRIQKEFESDHAWQRNVPGKTVLREEIRNFDDTKK